MKIFFGYGLPKKGRGQKAEGRREEILLMCLMSKGFKAPNFSYEKLI